MDPEAARIPAPARLRAGRAPTVRARLTRAATLVACGAVGLVAAGTVALAVASPADADERGAAGTCDGVWVVVDATELEGPLTTRCAPGDPSSGLAALEGAGHRYEFVPRVPGMVCTIDARPDPCNDAPADAYWSYWTAEEGGSWTYSSRGAGERDPAPGDVDGWAFGAGDPPGTSPPASEGEDPGPSGDGSSDGDTSESSGSGSSGSGSSETDSTEAGSAGSDGDSAPSSGPTGGGASSDDDAGAPGSAGSADDADAPPGGDDGTGSEGAPRSEGASSDASEGADAAADRADPDEDTGDDGAEAEDGTGDDGEGTVPDGADDARDAPDGIDGARDDVVALERPARSGGSGWGGVAVGTGLAGALAAGAAWQVRRRRLKA